MKSSIYDALVGEFAEDQPYAHVGPERRRVLSIVNNLDRLFNTRRGALQHLPDYGLPDISEIYRDIPESIPDLQRAIRDSVEKYEPRLTNVHVTHREAEEDKFDMTLTFVLSAQVVGHGRVRFQTTFKSSEAAHVKPTRRL